LRGGEVRFELLIDRPRDEAFEAANGFTEREAVCLAAGHVRFRPVIAARLGQGDPVEHGVEVAVARAAEPVAVLAGRGGLKRGDATVGSELGFGAKDARAGEGDNGAGREGSDAGDGSQGGEVVLPEFLDAPGKVGKVRLGSEPAAGEGVNEGEADAGAHALDRRAEVDDCLRGVLAGKATQGLTVGGVEPRETGVDLIAQADDVLKELLAVTDEDRELFPGAVRRWHERFEGSVLAEGPMDIVQNDPRVVEVYLGR